MTNIETTPIHLYTRNPAEMVETTRDAQAAVRWVDEDPNRFASQGGRIYADRCWRSISTGAKVDGPTPSATQTRVIVKRVNGRTWYLADSVTYPYSAVGMASQTVGELNDANPSLHFALVHNTDSDWATLRLAPTSITNQL